MSHQKEILRILKGLKGSGRFVSYGTTDFILPGLRINKEREVPFPISPDQIDQIIRHAHQAPYGKGSETLVDKSVRNTWEVDSAGLTFDNPAWNEMLKQVIGAVKDDLGISRNKVRAELHKLLLYEEGGHFARHKDTEKGKDMFGSLIIYLPSKYTGGELVVDFEQEEAVIDFSENSPYKLGYAAFYSDCDHEIKPVRSGTRICLTYNLFYEKSENKVDLVSVRKASNEVALALRNTPQNSPDQPVIVLLGHQYTPTNFSSQHLKLNDRLKAEVLLRAADQIGAYGKLCLVTSYQMGPPPYDSYGLDDDYAEEIGEVYSSSLSIEHWAEESGVPGLNRVEFEEDDLITESKLDEDEPIEMESTGYMGNWGPDVEHWYHYGAVVIWSKQANADLLPSQDKATKLNWIGHFNRQKEISDPERAAVRSIILAGGNNGSFRDEYTTNDFEFLEWMMVFGEGDLLFQMDPEVFKKNFTAIAPPYWMKLIKSMPLHKVGPMMEPVIENADLLILEKWISLTVQMSDEQSLAHLVGTYTSRFADTIRSLYSATKNRIKKETYFDLIELEKSKALAEKGITALAESLFHIPEWSHIHKVIAPVLKEGSRESRLRAELHTHTLDYLRPRVADQPQPPPDWSRPVPENRGNREYWEILRPFMESPTMRVFDYKRNQKERDDMERAISGVAVDLEKQTIRQGSPHTLRLTKTQDNYEKKMRKWEQDGMLLAELENRM